MAWGKNLFEWITDTAHTKRTLVLTTLFRQVLVALYQSQGIITDDEERELTALMTAITKLRERYR